MMTSTTVWAGRTLAELDKHELRALVGELEECRPAGDPLITAVRARLRAADDATS